MMENEVKSDKRMKSNKDFFEGLVSAFSEVKLIVEGKKKPNSFDDLLDELQYCSKSSGE